MAEWLERSSLVLNIPVSRQVVHRICQKLAMLPGMGTRLFSDLGKMKAVR